jgi:hypothetical protein
MVSNKYAGCSPESRDETPHGLCLPLEARQESSFLMSLPRRSRGTRTFRRRPGSNAPGTRGRALAPSKAKRGTGGAWPRAYRSAAYFLCFLFVGAAPSLSRTALRRLWRGRQGSAKVGGDDSSKVSGRQ